MTRILFMLLFLAFVAESFCQKLDSNITIGSTKDPYEIKTLFGKNNKIGGYGAFSFGFSQTNNKNTLIAGGRGGVIIGQHLTLGIGGRGFSTDYDWVNSTDGTKYYQLGGGYGGLFLEPIILPRFPVHLAFPVLFGAGGVGSYYSYYDTANEYWRDVMTDDAVFFVFEPGVELEFNLTKFFRLSFGAYYRYTTDVSLDTYKKDVLNGLSALMVFKFGKF